jgi:hypothetical protein
MAARTLRLTAELLLAAEEYLKIELLKEGKARDIMVEFRRLQAGEPA